MRSRSHRATVRASRVSAPARRWRETQLRLDPLHPRAELPPHRDNPDPNASALLGQVGGVQLDVGERGGEVYGDAQFHTASAEDAQNMSQVAQGLLALGRMITKNNADLAPVSGVLAAIRVEPQDRQLKVGIRFAAKQVVEAFDSTIRAREKANAAGASKENAP